jgi:hypothetical protein
MVVMLDERFDLSFEIAGQEVVFQQVSVVRTFGTDGCVN